MEEIRHFLELSTIHGLYYVSSAKNLAKYFWILVVFGGFIGAGYLINESFDNWNQSPISTTIETLPISELTYPNITVCPPRNSFLDLNYDILEAEKVKLDNETRKEMFHHVLEIIALDSHNEMMNNLSKLEDPDRYHNWYHGYTGVKYPTTSYKRPYNTLFTSATSGNISTQYFGETFDADKGRL